MTPAEDTFALTNVPPPSDDEIELLIDLMNDIFKLENGF